MRLSRALAQGCDALSFAAPVDYVYNPLVYARVPHELYLRRWGQGPKELLFLGMNPGPWGMMQTGVPFGEVEIVRDWLGVNGPVATPPRMHPKRPVLGFACTRSEVSGRRLWGWARDRFGSPEAFFTRAFVWNYCPLGFLDVDGRNITPDKLSVAMRAPMQDRCDRALRELIDALAPRWVIGVGGFAEQCLRRVVGEHGPRIGRIPHPSPASPAANRDWAGDTERALAAMGIALPRP